MLRTKISGVKNFSEMLKPSCLVVQTASRHLHRSIFSRTPSEVRISVPWGQIAGKWWGPKHQRPIIALHGWQDNCGSFDRLFPLLPNTLSILAIDLPGHGKSSRLPVGMIYYHVNYVLLIRMLQRKFGFKKMMLMGHSMGGFTSSMFAAYFPDAVQFVVCFDFFKPLHLESRVKNRPADIDKFIKFNDQLRQGSKQPKYTMEQLAVLWREGSLRSVDLDCCKYILERSIKPAENEPDKYYLTRDPRVKLDSMFNYDKKELVDAFGKIRVPFFISKGRDSYRYERKEDTREVLDALRDNNKACQYHVVGGTHHHHLNNPEAIQEALVKFLNKYYVIDSDVSSLRKNVKIIIH